MDKMGFFGGSRSSRRDDPTVGTLAASALEEDEHEVGEEEVEFFSRSQVAEFVDLETAFPKGRLLG